MVIPSLLPFLPEYFDVTYLQLGLGMSILMTVTILVQVPMGYLVDRFGALKLLFIALMTSFVALMSLVFVQDFIWFLIVMALLGLSNTVYHPADYSLLMQEVNQNRLGRAFSLHTFSGYLGTAVTPGLMIACVLFSGPKTAFLLASVLSFVAALFVIISPGQLGRYRARISAGFSKRTTALTGTQLTGASLPTAPADTSGLPEKVPQKQIRALLPTEPAMRRLFLIQISLLTFFFALLTASQSPLQEFGSTVLIFGYHFSETDAAIAVSAFLLCAALGVLLGGLLADRSHKHGLISIYLFSGSTVLTLLLTLIPLTFVPLVVVMSCIGLLLGAIAPSRDMMVKHVSQPGAEGRIFAIVSTGFSVGGAIAPLYLSWFLDQEQFSLVFFAGAAAMFLVVVISIFQEHKTRQISRLLQPEEAGR